ncbi:hypothetical protein [Aeromonas molluscorum]|jgi:hypothetical protein|uniref:Uncharacterized protein n=1 Tax=Aeromonas molluscorum 848 TaxID=1268236 RepID=R1F5D5_9GAMM|nr:hypothetical protein [Aeromonas molluscorum]EOD55063.1 hypothetical protein G113_10969 [Aeromonas molluscorum 848]
MKSIEEQASRLDKEYLAITLLFDQFCQQAVVLAEQYHFFCWPDDEEARPQCRAFTLFGEDRELVLHCQAGESGALIGFARIRDGEGRLLASLGFDAEGQLLLSRGRLLDQAADQLLGLLLGAMVPLPPAP